jgi:hypothetical protein
MSSSSNEQEKGNETQKTHVLSDDALNTLISLRQTLIDEALGSVERTISHRSDWMLAIAGGTFAALISSGHVSPNLVNWSTKELLCSLVISSLLGVIVKFFGNQPFQFMTLTRADIEKIKETFAKEVGEDAEKSRRLRAILSNYLVGEFLKLLKGCVSNRRYAKIERKLVKEKRTPDTDQRVFRDQVRRSLLYQCQFWTLFGGILIYVILVIFTY